MTRSKTIDMMKVPSDPWAGREYLLSEFLPLVLEASKEHIQNRYKAREQLEASLQFLLHGLTDAPSAEVNLLARMWYFPWTEAEHELSLALNHALLGFHRASYDHQRRGLELILVGSFFISEKTSEEEARKWVSSYDQTPMFTKTLKHLAKVGLYAELEARIGWVNEIQKFYWELSDISHVRGEQKGFRFIQPSHLNFNGVPVPEYSTDALEKALDSFVATMGYIALLIVLSNPVLVFGLPLTEKHGINGPASGFFEEWQAELVRALIPERHRDVLVALAEADPGVVSIRDYFSSLPDLTAEQFKKQSEDFDNQMKESPQVRGEPQGRTITIPLGPSSDGRS